MSHSLVRRRDRLIFFGVASFGSRQNLAKEADLIHTEFLKALTTVSPAEDKKRNRTKSPRANRTCKSFLDELASPPETTSPFSVLFAAY